MDSIFFFLIDAPAYRFKIIKAALFVSAKVLRKNLSYFPISSVIYSAVLLHWKHTATANFSTHKCFQSPLKTLCFLVKLLVSSLVFIAADKLKAYPFSVCRIENSSCSAVITRLRKFFISFYPVLQRILYIACENRGELPPIAPWSFATLPIPRQGLGNNIIKNKISTFYSLAIRLQTDSSANKITRRSPCWNVFGINVKVLLIIVLLSGNLSSAKRLSSVNKNPSNASKKAISLYRLFSSSIIRLFKAISVLYSILFLVTSCLILCGT